MKNGNSKKETVTSVVIKATEVALLCFSVFGIAIALWLLITELKDFQYCPNQISAIATLSVGLVGSSLSLMMLIRNFLSTQSEEIKRSLQLNEEYYSCSKNSKLSFTAVVLADLYDQFPCTYEYSDDTIIATPTNTAFSKATYTQALVKTVFKHIWIISDQFSSQELDFFVIFRTTPPPSLRMMRIY